jgi:hypothetical protein
MLFNKRKRLETEENQAFNLFLLEKMSASSHEMLALRLLKCHHIQEKLVQAIIDNESSAHKEALRRFIKLYYANPNANLNDLVDQEGNR